MTKELIDDELKDISGGVIVEVPDSWGKTAYALCDEKLGGYVYHVYYDEDIAKLNASRRGFSTEVISTKEYEKRFKKEFKL